MPSSLSHQHPQIVVRALHLRLFVVYTVVVALHQVLLQLRYVLVFQFQWYILTVKLLGLVGGFVADVFLQVCGMVR